MIANSIIEFMLPHIMYQQKLEYLLIHIVIQFLINLHEITNRSNRFFFNSMYINYLKTKYTYILNIKLLCYTLILCEVVLCVGVFI